MIRNSPKGLRLSLRRIRGGKDSEVFGVDSHVVGPGLGVHWALMDGIGCCEDAGENGGKQDGDSGLDMSEVDPSLIFLVVGMSKGVGLADLLELRHWIPYKYKACGQSLLFLDRYYCDALKLLRRYFLHKCEAHYILL